MLTYFGPAVCSGQTEDGLTGRKDMRPALFLTVRTGSTRLPHKPLLKIDGQTIVEFMIDRLKGADVSQTFVLCTTDRPEDQTLVDFAREKGIDWYRGSASDILARHLGAAREFQTDFIVNVDGDDVFCDPRYVDRTAEHFARTGADFIRWIGLPLGASPIGVNTIALARVCELKETSDTETGWGSFFTETGLFRVETLEETDPELRHPEIRMTLDYPEDYAFVKEMYKRLERFQGNFTLRDIMQVIKEHPTIAEINKHLQETYYREFERRKTKVRLRAQG